MEEKIGYISILYLFFISMAYLLDKISVKGLQDHKPDSFLLLLFLNFTSSFAPLPLHFS